MLVSRHTHLPDPDSTVYCASEGQQSGGGQYGHCLHSDVKQQSVVEENCRLLVRTSTPVIHEEVFTKSVIYVYRIVVQNPIYSTAWHLETYQGGSLQPHCYSMDRHTI